MTGPGVVVTLRDSPRSPEPEEDPYPFLVHDVDIQTLVHELWASGAEAISVNGQRLVTRSPIRCAGPIVLINGVKVGGPYEVRAIGPADQMAGALRMPGGFRDNLQPLFETGGDVEISVSDEVVVEAFTREADYRYAKPVRSSKD